MKARSLVVGLSLLLTAAIVLIRPAGRDQDSTGARFAEQPARVSSSENRAGSNAESESETPGNAKDDDATNARPARTEDIDSEMVSDEDLRWVRDETFKEVTVDYSLMLSQLALTKSEHTGMIDFLVEVAMSGTHMAGHRPVPIDEADRGAGIAALIGEAKLESFLALEQDRFEYREAQLIANLLEANGVPLTAAKHDRLLDLLIVVRERQQAGAGPDVESGTLEWVETMHAELNDYERLVLELSPSVLSAAQQELLYKRYNSLWMRRVAFFERQKQMRANDESFPLAYLRRQ